MDILKILQVDSITYCFAKVALKLLRNKFQKSHLAFLPLVHIKLLLSMGFSSKAKWVIFRVSLWLLDTQGAAISAVSPTPTPTPPPRCSLQAAIYCKPVWCSS